MTPRKPKNSHWWRRHPIKHKDNKKRAKELAMKGKGAWPGTATDRAYNDDIDNLIDSIGRKA